MTKIGNKIANKKQNQEYIKYYNCLQKNIHPMNPRFHTRQYIIKNIQIIMNIVQNTKTSFCRCVSSKVNSVGKILNSSILRRLYLETLSVIKVSKLAHSISI